MSHDYRAIAAWLRHRIETGELPAGDRIPGSAELMKLFDVGEHTARKALRELKNESLTCVDPGRGTFARETRPVQRLIFGEHAPDHPFWPTTSRATIVSHTHEWTARSTLDVALALNIPPGSDVRIHHSYYAAPRREIQLAVIYRPAHLTDPGPPVRFRDELRVRLPDAPERDRMELTIAAPVIALARTAYAGNGQPIELIHTVMDANAYLLEYHHPAIEGSADHA